MGKHGGGGPSKPARAVAERNGKTAAPRTTVQRSHEGTAGYLRSVFERDLSDQEIAGMAGALPGSTVHFGRAGVIDVRGPRNSYHAQVTVQQRPEVRGTILFNWFYRSGRSERSKIPDPRVLATQVRAARRLGISQFHVKTSHVGGDYWRLTQLGYDARVDAHLRAETRHLSIPAKYAGLRMLSDILKAPGGARWWQQNGMSPGLDFKTRRGSYSSTKLDEVVRQSGEEGIEA
jgi:hypothetical protein